jgi:hypothetical protein
MVRRMKSRVITEARNERVCSPVNYFLKSVTGCSYQDYCSRAYRPPADGRNNYVMFHHGEPGRSVSIVSGYGLDSRAIEVQTPAEAKGFFL